MKMNAYLLIQDAVYIKSRNELTDESGPEYFRNRINETSNASDKWAPRPSLLDIQKGNPYLDLVMSLGSEKAIQ
jgi:hypothetical protein